MNEKLILAQGYELEGRAGLSRPNDNVVGVGCSGTGKSMSLAYPNMLAMEESSVIASFAKPVEAYSMARAYQRKGYIVKICDLYDPRRGDVCFDPIKHLSSSDDVRASAEQIVMSVLKKTNDDYWNGKAKPLLTALMDAALMLHDDPSMADVLEMFDELNVVQEREGISTALDGIFEELEECDPNSVAVREFKAFRMLPFRTASCVRDTLAAALSAVFPDSVRKAMREKPNVEFEQLGVDKVALFFINNPASASVDRFMNLAYDAAIKDLLDFASMFPDGKLLRPVKLVFDDFACTAAIQEFPKQISIFRAAGLSALILLQSESQLRAIYGDGNATTILNNCACYVYFPGGMDQTTCESVSRRMNLPMEDVMYAPTGQVFVMHSGKKPTVRKRYDILHDPRYQDMMGGSRRGQPIR